MTEHPGTNPQATVERNVATQITDMMGYSRYTAHMSPAEIRDFIIHYHRNLKDLICGSDDGAVEFTPMAGDSSVTVYPLDASEHVNAVPLNTAIRIARAIESGSLLPTRVGIYAGQIIEAGFENNTLSFGAAYAAAARLEQLCNYFRVWFLVDRNIAFSDLRERDYMISIGKITPKNFNHPIHAYTAYKPGINNCPVDIDQDGLLEFIRCKNEAMDYFSGNTMKDIECNFPEARTRLIHASGLFQKLTGHIDHPTVRVLDYIDKHPLPSEDFHRLGMKIGTSATAASDRSSAGLPGKLLRALDYDLYQALVDETEWERYFVLEWRTEGEEIIHAGDQPDSIYYIESGKVCLKDSDGKIIGRLGEGEVFGEMAYFTMPPVRTANVIAETDLVLRKISGVHFSRYPELRQVFAKIASNRLSRKELGGRD